MGIHQAGRDFDNRRVDGWSPLLLKNDTRFVVWLCGILEDGSDAYAVNIGVFRTGETLA
jgi:hypothetical protein